MLTTNPAKTIMSNNFEFLRIVRPHPYKKNEQTSNTDLQTCQEPVTTGLCALFIQA